jgi:hypothetical protein
MARSSDGVDNDRVQLARPVFSPGCTEAHRSRICLSKVQSVDQQIRLECGVGFRQTADVPSHSSGELCADFVAKVENRTTLKISRKLIFRLLCCCFAIQRRYEGPWSISDGSIWSLTSPRVKRISGSKNFRSTPQKDFCNKICQQRTFTQWCGSAHALKSFSASRWCAPARLEPGRSARSNEVALRGPSASARAPNGRRRRRVGTEDDNRASVHGRSPPDQAAAAVLPRPGPSLRRSPVATRDGRS